MLKSIKPGSKQAEIPTGMLTEVQARGEFIQGYAKDAQLCTLPSSTCCRRLQIYNFAAKRTLKNIAGVADPRLQQHCDALAELKQAFLDHAIITIQRRKLEMLVRRSDGLRTVDPTTSTQTERDAKIDGIPYRPGWRACTHPLRADRHGEVDHCTRGCTSLSPEEASRVVLRLSAGGGFQTQCIHAIHNGCSRSLRPLRLNWLEGMTSQTIPLFRGPETAQRFMNASSYGHSRVCIMTIVFLLSLMLWMGRWRRFLGPNSLFIFWRYHIVMVIVCRNDNSSRPASSRDR